MQLGRDREIIQNVLQVAESGDFDATTAGKLPSSRMFVGALNPPQMQRKIEILKIKYFAYGSNMLTARLRYRVPSCECASIAYLPAHKLRFHKRSNDGSSKCDAFYTGLETDLVWGVVFDIPATEKPRLDRAEGLGRGYNEHVASVMSTLGKSIEAITYRADAAAIVKDQSPYTWYMDFVVKGAAEHGLPNDYVATAIHSTKGMPDPSPGREKDERSKLRN